ncbi:MAG: MFS transporter [Acidimicrobiales bacterium]|nr:MFS transporter [Acidimicrobiales bacterium]
MTALLQRLRNSEALLVLCGSTFLVMVGQGIVSPVLPLYAKDFGVGAEMVGLTLTVFALARLILNIPAGMLADRFGRRVLLIGGPIITAVGMFGSGFADSIWTLLFWRFIAGGGSAFYMSGAMIYLIDIAPPEKRARYVATNQWALSVGVAVGPGIGGLVADTYSLSTPFHVVGVTAIATAIYAAVRLPETRGQADTGEVDPDQPPVSAWTFLTTKRFLLVAAVTATIFMTRAGTRGTLTPLHATEALDWGPSEIGLVFMVTGFMTLFTLMPAAWASDRLGRSSVILFSGVMAAAGTAVVASSTSAGGFVVGNIIMTLGTGTAGPAPAAYVADIAPPNLRGMAVALYRSAGDVGFLAAPPLLGFIGESTSLPTAMYVAAVLVAVTAVMFSIGSRGDSAAGRQVS